MPKNHLRAILKPTLRILRPILNMMLRILRPILEKTLRRTPRRRKRKHSTIEQAPGNEETHKLRSNVFFFSGEL